jgi:hypothetical protein
MNIDTALGKDPFPVKTLLRKNSLARCDRS